MLQTVGRRRVQTPLQGESGRRVRDDQICYGPTAFVCWIDFNRVAADVSAGLRFEN
ncbi:hypothetical protein D3C83_158210 [compost metagenome]